MKKSKLLDDAQYDKEVERLSGLPRFPQVPSAQKELRRALRRISDSDEAFLHKLISDAVDTALVCPTPADLLRMAGEKRQRIEKSVGATDCPDCGGSGFLSTTHMVKPAGLEPYETDFAAPCACRRRKL